MKQIFPPLLGILCFFSCSRSITSTEVLVTSESGKKCETVQPVTFTKGVADGAVVVNPAVTKQAIEGFGASLTESTAFVLACLEPEQRRAVLEEFFGENGANFSAARTVIGSSDFTVEGNYSYDDVAGDTLLEHFSLDVHKDGFPKEKYPQIKDPNYDVYQLIMEVQDIKHMQPYRNEWRLIASPWTAPAWMKDNNMFYDKQNRYGGALLPQYYQTYADYLLRFLQEYRKVSVDFWAITPENEPMGNDGSWESMHLSPQVEAELIGKYIGPTLYNNDFGIVKILGFDQNTFEAGQYTDAIFSDPQASHYTAGTALHWYGSTVSCFPEVLDSLHNLYPDKILLHTEGCIDNLGRDGWPGVSDMEGYKESEWFNNDSFWWNKNATDWAYSTPFWPEWHPKYAPVHRYAQYIIDGLNHWLTGYVDWNMVLDSIGGPTHVGNNCGAELMVNYNNYQPSTSLNSHQPSTLNSHQPSTLNPQLSTSHNLYFTPYYYVLKQFSRSMRPNDVVIETSDTRDEDLHICAVLKSNGSYAVQMLNTSKQAKTFDLQIGEYFANITLEPNCVETIVVKL